MAPPTPQRCHGLLVSTPPWGDRRAELGDVAACLAGLDLALPGLPGLGDVVDRWGPTVMSLNSYKWDYKSYKKTYLQVLSLN